MSFTSVPQEQQNCGNCYYAKKLWHFDRKISCQVHPPRQAWPEGPLWPVVSIDDWCGHWVMAEPKREPE